MRRQTGPLDEAALREALHEMAHADAGVTTPPHVEELVLEAWDARRPLSTPRWRSRGAVWGALAVAASLIIAVVLRGRDASVATHPAQGSDRQAASTVGRHANTPYETIAWLDSDPSTLQVVRLRVPSATLAEQGYNLSGLDGAGSVEVEVIMGADGEARSVRVSPAWPEMMR